MLQDEMRDKPRILSASGSIPSAKGIRDEIEKLTGVHYYIAKPGEKVQNVLFRYGNSSLISGAETNLNSPEFIEMVKNKGVFDMFCRAHEIFSPIYKTIADRPEKYPVLIRTTLTGFQGKGIIVCKTEEEFKAKIRPGIWWTDYVPCAFELRIHLFGNKIESIYKKIKNEEGEENIPIRNLENGYHFSNRTENLEQYAQLIPVCKNIGDLFLEIGGKFSALDVGWNTKVKKYFIFEANSAPGLNTISLGKYARYFCEQLQLDVREE